MKPVLAATACAVLALLSVACGGVAEGPATSAGSAGAPPADVSAAALVPGADLVARIDVAAIRATPGCKDLVAEGDAEEAGAASGKDATEANHDMDFAAFERVTGLKPDDVVSVVVAADMDSVDLDATSGRERFETANGVLAVHLARRLPPATLAEAIKAANAGRDDHRVSEIQVAGNPAVHIESARADDAENGKPPDVYVASGAGEGTVFVAGNPAALEGALSRARSGQFEQIPAALEAVRRTLPEAAQARFAFLAPEKLQRSVRQQLAEARQDPESAMAAGMLGPFEGLQSIGLGMQCGSEMQVAIGADLGSAESASQAAGLLNGMLLPMVNAGMAEKLGKPPADLADRISISTSESGLSISVRFTREDLAGLRKQAPTQDAPDGSTGAAEEEAGD